MADSDPDDGDQKPAAVEENADELYSYFFPADQDLGGQPTQPVKYNDVDMVYVPYKGIASLYRDTSGNVWSSAQEFLDAPSDPVERERFRARFAFHSKTKNKRLAKRLRELNRRQRELKRGARELFRLGSVDSLGDVDVVPDGVKRSCREATRQRMKESVNAYGFLEPEKKNKSVKKPVNKGNCCLEDKDGDHSEDEDYLDLEEQRRLEELKELQVKEEATQLDGGKSKNLTTAKQVEIINQHAWKEFQALDDVKIIKSASDVGLCGLVTHLTKVKYAKKKN